ncbi:MAG: dihydropteroate synthase [Actinomycetota bacterium]
MTNFAADWTPPRVMGVLNVTPDSFSDGGKFESIELALQHAKELVDAGADLIDIGGESTRPGARRIPLEVEQQRILPVIQAIRTEFDIPISIDTLNSQTAAAAVALGAQYVNDVSGGRADNDMFGTLADLDAKLIIGHWRGPSETMDGLASYKNVAHEVAVELEQQLIEAQAAGITADRIIIDPGLGFAKDINQNWQLVARLDELKKFGLPILVGASRKRFIASALNQSNPAAVTNERRDVATAVLTALLLQRGLWGVRVHNVAATRDAIALVAALKRAEASDDS